MLRFKIIDKIQSSGHIRPRSFLAKNAGFGNSKATKFHQDRQQSITLADLSSLCRTLHCTPNDLLYWRQDTKKPLPAEHPCIAQLAPPAPESNWAALTQQLSTTKREKVYALLQQLETEEEEEQGGE